MAMPQRKRVLPALNAYVHARAGMRVDAEGGVDACADVGEDGGARANVGVGACAYAGGNVDYARMLA